MAAWTASCTQTLSSVVAVSVPARMPRPRWQLGSASANPAQRAVLLHTYVDRVGGRAMHEEVVVHQREGPF